MPPREDMPLHQLLAPWWAAAERPRLAQVPAMREALLAAALDELRLKTAAGILYDPFSDLRVCWGVQFLNHQEDRSIRIPPNLTAYADWTFAPSHHACGKDRSVGST